MDCPVARIAPSAAPQVDFALVGHPESWKAAAEVFSALRGPEHTPLPDDEIRDILPWIPPRAVCRVGVKSIDSDENTRAPFWRLHFSCGH